ncbi:MAG: ATP-binding protein, partial [Acidobacteriota bacterium]
NVTRGTALRDRFFGRLLVAILVSMAVSEVAVDVVVYYRLRATLEADLGQRLVRTANALVLSIDPRLVSQFRTGDDALDAYQLVRARLERQVRANGLGRAYVVDRQLRTLIDSDDGAFVGDARYALMAERSQTAQAWNGTATATPLYVNEAGELRLTALAPLRAGSSVIGLLGVDAAPEFFAALSDLRREMVLLGVASLAVAGLGGLVLIRGASRRLDRVRDTVARASRGDFTAPDDARGSDQLGALERDLDGLVESIVARVDYYESLMASVNIGLMAIDLQGRVVGANTTAARWFADDPPMVGRPLLAALSAHAELSAFAAEAVAHSSSGLTREITIRGGEAAGHTLAVVVSPLVQGGRHTGTTLSLSDVTALRALERQARAQERLASLGTMAAGLLHEVRTPLASVMMHLDLLRASVADHEGLEVLDQALASTERLSRFLVDFQIVAGLRPLRRDWVDVRDALDAVLESVTLPPSIRLDYAPDGPAVVHADRDLLEHAARNLVVNAIEALGAVGGTITIALARSDGDIVLTVSDTGPGLTLADADRVFDPMFTTKPTGTGLGLTIATRVVDAHGGSIQVANAPSGGAVFTVRWPRGEQR